MNTEKRLILALVLFIFIMLFYQWYLGRFVSPPAQEGVAKVELAGEPLRYEPELEKETQPPVPQGVIEDIHETDTLRIGFSGHPGNIISVGLKGYQNPQTGKPQEVFGATSPGKGAFSLMGLGRMVKTAEAREGPKDRIYTYLTDKNWKITKKYVLEEGGYIIGLRLRIENLANKQRSLKYRLLAGSGITQDSYMAERFTQAIVSEDNNILRVVSRKVKKEEAIYTGKIAWVALRGKYYSLVLKPTKSGRTAFVSTAEKEKEKGGGRHLLAGISREASLPSQGSLSEEYLLFVGPNKYRLLNSFGAKEVASFGKLDGICRLLLRTLEVIYGVVHNYGVAIMLLTFLVSLVLYPLTWKSVISMKKMQKLQPHLKKLQAEHKDNPQKLNKEMMELYRKHKVNPIGGCLPMLLQMPIFIALYQVLMRSIELKGAGFLWIKDLSGPDAAFRLPLSLPIIGDAVNILPLLMIAAMFLQQKTHAAPATTPEQQQQQKMMGLLMPIFMGFIFYNMPSGFVLYILVSTFLTAAYQRLASRGVSVE